MGRFRFQYSLMTAVVVMLMAGGLLGLNLYVFHEHYPTGNVPIIWRSDLISSIPNANLSTYDEFYVMGWPFAAYVSIHCPRMKLAWGGEYAEYSFSQWRWSGLAADSVVALVIIIPAGVLCEWFVRRRTPRSPPKEA